LKFQASASNDELDARHAQFCASIVKPNWRISGVKLKLTGVKPVPPSPGPKTERADGRETTPFRPKTHGLAWASAQAKNPMKNDAPDLFIQCVRFNANLPARL
jgi:hypothetical protein